MRGLARQKINWLSVFIILAFVINYVPSWQNGLLLFWFSVLGLIVTSAWIGTATEQLAGRIGPTWGGMMNAGFGNLPELIFGLIAIRDGLGPLAKAAWTGAIVSNILVVNGAAMVVAGLRFGRIRFSMERAQDAGASLMIASVAVFLPSIYAESRRHLPTPQMSTNYVEEISLGLCVLLLILYAAAMVRIAQRARARTMEATAAAPDLPEPAGAAMSTGLAIALLAISSLLVALLSDFVAGSVDVVKQTLGWTDLFIGVIVVALIGNVSALFSAVKVAQTNQMDLAFEIGISSAAQIALLVVPVLVIASPFLGNPVNILFSTAEVAAIFGSVLVISQISQDGEANWLSGVQMLVLYGLIGVLFYFLPSPT
jgi:Ca2+:H+ antiporter